MEIQTVHLQKNKSASDAKIYYLFLPIVAFFLIFIIYFVFSNFSKGRTAIFPKDQILGAERK